MGLVGTWPKLRNMCFFITVSGRLVCFSLLVLPIILEMVLIVPLRLQGLGDTFPTFFCTIISIILPCIQGSGCTRNSSGS